MKLEPNYRTVILQCFPSERQVGLLSRAEASVLRFLGISRLTLQKLLYHKFLESGDEIDPRMLSLLCKRFTGSLGEKAVLVFDKDNSKFVNDGGFWFVEVKLQKGVGQRIRIPIAKTEVKYYDVINEISHLPFMLVRENDKWFLYVSVKCSEKPNGKIIGVDFNFDKWVAAPYEGQPIFFNASRYSRKVDEIQRRISRWQSIISLNKNKEKVALAEERIRYLHDVRSRVVALAHGEFLARIREKYGVCTIGVEEVTTMYKLRDKGSRILNNWLYSKTSLRKFILRAMAKGFNVVEVNPEDTSSTC
ncbi:MAG: hypothetical protein QW161_06435, partial [Candidatus Bathyarchaeia archaeon]